MGQQAKKDLSKQAKKELKTAQTLVYIGIIMGLLAGFGLVYSGILVHLALNLEIASMGFGVWCILCSFIVGSSFGRIWRNPSEHAKRGKLILIFSILGVSTIVAAAAGVITIRYKPQALVQKQSAYPEAEKPVESSQPIITRICPHCGRVLEEDVKFCPYCGKNLE